MCQAIIEDGGRLTQMTKRIFIQLFLIFGFTYFVSSKGTKYLNHVGNRHVFYQTKSSLLIHSQESLNYAAGVHTLVTIVVPTGQRVRLLIEEMELEYIGQTCNDVVKIFDGPDANSKLLTDASGLCGSKKGKHYTSTLNIITFMFTTDANVQDTGFVILATSFFTGECGIDEFQCDNGLCVNKLLIKDGHDNCADNSDELLDKHTWGHLLCDNGKSIPDPSVCDGHDDCGDYSDETSCDCIDLQYECQEGVCRTQEVNMCPGVPQVFSQSNNDESYSGEIPNMPFIP
ncbi:suppressor of tumorigenicity 14 protein homolog [Anneissia japonica]|uniref:suppressor of tumorigenicity 14 protein homolog n=1 Tax=Anneissia japonica TaxID=1529436 RepID=UPI0014255CCA|nr:suppressor of tumorigenicity 14 protein homolog [Anneissia japonica]